MPGEDLGGIYSARAFVGWYNGLPEYADLNPDLMVGEEAVVVGNGNVALDVARVLLSGVDRLRTTDITEYALAALSKSRVRHVTVIGRRGPSQAAFTIKEVRELLALSGIGFDLKEPDLLPGSGFISTLPKLEQRKYRTAQLLRKGSRTSLREAKRWWSLQSMASPAAFTGQDGQVASVTLSRTEFVDHEQRFDPAAKVRSTGEGFQLPCSLAFRSIGYESSSIPGLDTELGIQFDGKRGVLPNDAYGRVVEPPLMPSLMTGKHIPGCYSAGWVKRGPTGVIASTMDDAFATADTIIEDWEGKRPFLNSNSDVVDTIGWDAVKGSDAARRLAKVVNWTDWKAIDAAERQRGQANGKEREKFGTVREMLQVLG